MSRIGDYADRILSMQANLGLESQNHYGSPLSDVELRESPLLLDIPSPSEIHQLFAWRNGASDKDVPMGQLWIKPGYYLVSVDESLFENRYCSDHLTGWSRSWYPLLTNGAAGRHFFDRVKIANGRAPIFNYEPEAAPVTGQIYDSVESMFKTILECYAQHAYFIAPDGLLATNFRREVEISRGLNPNSDYWWREDLFES